MRTEQVAFETLHQRHIALRSVILLVSIHPRAFFSRHRLAHFVGHQLHLDAEIAGRERLGADPEGRVGLRGQPGQRLELHAMLLDHLSARAFGVSGFQLRGKDRRDLQIAGRL